MDPRRSMVFVNTRRGAEQIEANLRANGINAEAISGDVPQRKRLRMLRHFHDGTLPVLIGTDVASRGLHIPDVSHVFNYDLPQDPEDYVHRIGRTARAGAEGDAISFGCEEYVMSLPDIEAYIGRKLPVAPVPLELLPDIKPAETRRRQRREAGARGGERRGRPARREGAATRQSTRRRRPAEPAVQAAQTETAPPPSGEAPPAPDPVAASADRPKRRRRRRRGSKPAGVEQPPSPPDQG